jgi:cytoskeletal protein CcmA (bactofilin family)
MFRKKDSESELPAGSDAFRRSAGEGSGAAKAAGQPELPRRKVDLPTGPAGGQQSAGAAATGAAEPVGTSPGERADQDRFTGKRLIVGEGIRLSGEISSCDRLVVEGEVEVTLNDTLAVEIASSGRFTGGCEVEEADISGVYEGDLTVRQRLIVRGTGKLTGTVRYGELELERGGQIAGNISVLDGDRSVGAASAGGRSPLFGGGNSGERRASNDGDDGEE